MKFRWLFLILLLGITFCNAVAQRIEAEKIPALTYDELYEKRADYVGKVVRVRAFHITGFEWSYLCGKDCGERPVKVWVDFLDEDDLCKGSKGKLKRRSYNDFDNRADVVYVGRFYSGGFGHFGVYPYQLTVSCVEKYTRMMPLH